jgi:hypothetical protein
MRRTTESNPEPHIAIYRQVGSFEPRFKLFGLFQEQALGGIVGVDVESILDLLNVIRGQVGEADGGAAFGDWVSLVVDAGENTAEGHACWRHA